MAPHRENLMSFSFMVRIVNTVLSLWWNNRIWIYPPFHKNKTTTITKTNPENWTKNLKWLFLRHWTTSSLGLWSLRKGKQKWTLYGPSFCLEKHFGCSTGKGIPSSIATEWTWRRPRQQEAEHTSREKGAAQKKSFRNLSRDLLESLLNINPCICRVKQEIGQRTTRKLSYPISRCT